MSLENKRARPLGIEAFSRILLSRYPGERDPAMILALFRSFKHYCQSFLSCLYFWASRVEIVIEIALHLYNLLNCFQTSALERTV